MSTITRPPSTDPKPERSQRGFATLAVAIVVVAVAGSIAIFSSRNQGAGTEPALELSLGSGDATTSCIPFDVAILRDMPIAFEGTATSTDANSVTLDVDHWYKGGEASQVRLSSSPGSQPIADGEALIGAFPFETGQTYLISATDGNVNFCGFSGGATDEFRSAFDQAFAS